MVKIEAGGSPSGSDPGAEDKGAEARLRGERGASMHDLWLAPAEGWRNLSDSEVGALEANGNSCADWSSFLVLDPFDPALVRSSRFEGLVRIGGLRPATLRAGSLSLPAGIYGSAVHSCDIGPDCAIHDAGFVSRCLLGRGVLVYRVGELSAAPGAAFGNGAGGAGMDLVNETGGRAVLPFPGILPADAALWASRRSDAELQGRLAAMAAGLLPAPGADHARVGDGSSIACAGRIVDADIGSGAEISGALKIERVSILSSPKDPVAIGEGTILSDGIVGPGCRILSGAVADRFALGAHATVKLGARLVHSYLGDNSTFAGGEILNSLVFPGHEQHHASSFLIAALVKGQSNLAAGVVAGSNHNSRAADGELRAGRGFWPGLCASFKHSSRFASYCLAAKGDYPAEIDLGLPFALISNDAARDALVLVPAFWWSSDMYALERGGWKARARDRRAARAQAIMADPLAPDTAEEIIGALSLLELWTGTAIDRARRGAGETGAGGKAALRDEEPGPKSAIERREAELRAEGRSFLLSDPAAADALEVLARGVEKSSRPVRVQRAGRAHGAYRDMLALYAVRAILDWMDGDPAASFAGLEKEAGGSGRKAWENLGGQLVTAEAAASLVGGIKEGRIGGWEALHAEYGRLLSSYPLDRAKHGLACLEFLGTGRSDGAIFGAKTWRAWLDRAEALQGFVRDQVRATRSKDLEDPFRAAIFGGRAELGAVVGELGEDGFIAWVDREQGEFDRRLALARERG